MTTIVSLMARKGGVGKTTMTVNLAAALRQQGKSVLVVESDGQGNASQALGFEARDDFYDLILGDREFQAVLREVPAAYAGAAGGMYLISAHIKQLAVETHSQTPDLIYERFKEVRGVFDVVLVDTSPGTTQVHTGWYYASDYILLPTLCDTFGWKGIESMIAFIASADQQGREAGYPAAVIIGILPNRYSKGVNNSQFNLGVICGKFQDHHRVFERIRENPAWETAARQSRSIYNLTTGADRRLAINAKDARKEFKQVVDAILQLEKVEAV